MKVIVDDKIPFIRGVIENIADEVCYIPGISISAGDVKDADAMFIRTRTHCNEELLEGSSVKFIATATIGFDHLDLDYLKKRNIAWSNCPGCNAASVGQYIRSCMLLLEREKGMKLDNCTMGIVGAGHVGMAVKKAVEEIGVKVMLNDPPREELEHQLDEKERTQFHSLDELCEKCNVLSFHTPLTKDGKYPTYHMVDEDFLKKLKPDTVLINSGRGSVFDNDALLKYMNKGHIGNVIIDTWEHEPEINRELLEKVYIGTPHIAGYSADGKANATRMALDAFCKFFNVKASYNITPPQLPENMVQAEDVKDNFLQLYNPHTDSLRLKNNPELFEELRGNYPLRREFF